MSFLRETLEVIKSLTIERSRFMRCRVAEPQQQTTSNFSLVSVRETRIWRAYSNRLTGDDVGAYGMWFRSSCSKRAASLRSPKRLLTLGYTHLLFSHASESRWQRFSIMSCVIAPFGDDFQPKKLHHTKKISALASKYLEDLRFFFERYGRKWRDIHFA